MAQVFTPPVAQGNPLALKRQHPAYPLFRHYAPHAAGRNFWIVDGVLTETQPEVLGPNDLALLGGHITPVTSAQQAIIDASGYGAFIATVADVAATSIGVGFVDPPDVSGTPGGFEAGFVDPPDIDPAVLSGSYGYGHYGDGFYGGSPT